MPDYFSASPASPQTHVICPFSSVMTTPNLPASSHGTGMQAIVTCCVILLCDNPASLHNPSYKYGHRTKSGHIPDYMYQYSQCSGKWHWLCRCTSHCLCASLIWRENSYSSDVTIQIPRHSDPDMRIQPQRLVLSKYTNRIDPGIDAVAQRKVNDPVLAAKSYCRFCNLCSKHAQPAALTAG